VKEPTILIHAREAGVASMMKPLIEPLQRSGYSLYFDVSHNAANILPSEPSGAIASADLVICGYDDPLRDRVGPFLERVSAYDIPALGLLDSWKGVDRFWFHDGGRRKLTNRLAVLDAAVRDYLISRNVPKDWPVVTGHPGLEMMRQISPDERYEYRNQGRQLLGVSDSEQSILFLSEPLRLSDGNRLSLLNANSKASVSIGEFLIQQYSKEYRLICRLHPIEVSKIQSPWLNGNNLTFEQALFSSDRVVGLSSTTLAYAVEAGLKVDLLDLDIEEWVPEYSDIPALLWQNLVDNNIFNKSHELSDCSPKSDSTSAVESILILVNDMING